jgi:replicative superfamily II helicase
MITSLSYFRILPHYLTNEECSKKNEDAEELIDALSIIAPTRSEICPIIAEGIPQRVSYHHAGTAYIDTSGLSVVYTRYDDWRAMYY